MVARTCVCSRALDDGWKSKLPDPPKWGPSLPNSPSRWAAVIIMNKKPF